MLDHHGPVASTDCSFKSGGNFCELRNLGPVTLLTFFTFALLGTFSWSRAFLPPRFHFSQLAQLPFEWPMARLSIDFPSVAASFSQNVSRLAVEKTSVGSGSPNRGLKLPASSLCKGHWTGSVSHCYVISGH